MLRRSAFRLAALPALLLACAAIGASPALAFDVDVVSRADGPAGTPTSDDLTYQEAPQRMTADGTQAIFGSADTSLLPGSIPPSGDFYLQLRNIAGGTTTFVGRADGAAGAVPNATVLFAALAPGGRYAAFASQASNLGVANANTIEVWLRDVVNGTTVLVSSPQGVPTAGNDSSNHPSVSADGGRVAFDSFATNLVADGTNAKQQVFVRDTATGAVTLVSRATGAAGAVGSGGNSGWPQISADGTHVAFLSDATNLVPGASSGQLHLYVRDLVDNTTVLADREPSDGTPMDYPVDNHNLLPSISYDGTRVAFKSFAKDGANAEIFVRDLTAGTTTVASRADGAAGAEATGAFGDGFAMSGNGRSVAFINDGGGLVSGVGSGAHLYVRDLQAGTTTHIPVGGPVGPAFDESGCLLTIASNDPSFSGTLLPAKEYLYRVRLCSTPGPTPTPTPTPTPISAPAPAPGGKPASLPPVFGTGGIIVGAPSTRSCLSRRSFRLRVRNPTGPVKVVSATVYVNGRKVAVRSGARLTAPVDLRKLPKGRYTVKITAKTDDGRTISDTRRYRTCTPKKKKH